MIDFQALSEPTEEMLDSEIVRILVQCGASEEQANQIIDLIDKMSTIFSDAGNGNGYPMPVVLMSLAFMYRGASAMSSSRPDALRELLMHITGLWDDQENH